jgi:hypothetical protein
MEDPGLRNVSKELLEDTFASRKWFYFRDSPMACLFENIARLVTDGCLLKNNIIVL